MQSRTSRRFHIECSRLSLRAAASQLLVLACVSAMAWSCSRGEPTPDDPVEANILELERFADMLENVPDDPTEAVARVRTYIEESGERRRLLRIELLKLSAGLRHELERAHGDALNHVTHRIVVADRELRASLVQHPKLDFEYRTLCEDLEAGRGRAGN